MPVVGRFQSNGDLEISGEFIEGQSFSISQTGNVNIQEIIEGRTDVTDTRWSIKDNKIYLRGQVIEGKIL